MTKVECPHFPPPFPSLRQAAPDDCWSVDLDETHHNQAFIEYSDWFALITLSGGRENSFKTRLELWQALDDTGPP